MKHKNQTFLSETKYLWLLLFIAVLFFGALRPSVFFTSTTMSAIAYQMPELGMFVLAMLLPIVSGGLNLAIIATGNLCALVFASILLHPAVGGMGLLVAVVAAVVCAVGIGVINGSIVAYVGAHPILVTLGSMTMINGIGIYFTRGTVVSGFSSSVLTWIGNGSLLWIPAPFVIFIAFSALTGFILSCTPFGLYVRMMGSNAEATRYSGVNISLVYMKIYIYSSLMALVGGVIMMSRFNSARVGYGDGYLLVSILVLILGGVEPLGGFGHVSKVVFALLVLQIVASGLNLLRADQHLIMVIWGFILLCTVICRHAHTLWQEKRHARHLIK